MKTIIVYESATGFTAQYAAWLAEELSAQSKALRDISRAALADFDRVIFGGWVMGDGIMGLEKLRAMAAPYAVFAVGSTPAYEEVVAKIQTQNKLGDTPLFYLVGGFRFEELGFVKKLLLKTLRKSVAKKEQRDRQGDFMAQALGTSFDHSERAQIAPLVEFCK